MLKAKKTTIEPTMRNRACVHLVYVTLDAEERAALDRIMALRQCQDDSAIGLALKHSLPQIEATAKATTLPALPYRTDP